MAVRLAWTLALIVGLPIGSYLVLDNGLPSVWLGSLDFVLATFVVSALCLDVRQREFPRRLALLVVLACVLLLVLISWNPLYVSYAPPLVIIAGLAWLFLDTLRPGREPLITRFARLERGGTLPSELVAYTRRLTWIWSALFAALFLELSLLALLVPVETYLLFANSYNYLVVATFFVIEYVYRRVRYRRYSHVSPLAFLGLLLRSNVFGSGKP